MSERVSANLRFAFENQQPTPSTHSLFCKSTFNSTENCLEIQSRQAETTNLIGHFQQQTFHLITIAVY